MVVLHERRSVRVPAIVVVEGCPPVVFTAATAPSLSALFLGEYTIHLPKFFCHVAISLVQSCQRSSVDWRNECSHIVHDEPLETEMHGIHCGKQITVSGHGF